LRSWPCLLLCESLLESIGNSLRFLPLLLGFPDCLFGSGLCGSDPLLLQYERNASHEEKAEQSY
jgi:hypothetical protein